MSRTSKPATDAEQADPMPSFEDAYGRLEAIVARMENNDLPLDELIEQYEQGTRLFAVCDKLLGKARERIDIITLKARSEFESNDDNAGASTNAPHPSRPLPSASKADGDDSDDDIRLF